MRKQRHDKASAAAPTTVEQCPFQCCNTHHMWHRCQHKQHLQYHAHSRASLVQYNNHAPCHSVPTLSCTWQADIILLFFPLPTNEFKNGVCRKVKRSQCYNIVMYRYMTGWYYTTFFCLYQQMNLRMEFVERWNRGSTNWPGLVVWLFIPGLLPSNQICDRPHRQQPTLYAGIYYHLISLVSAFCKFIV